MRGIVIGILVFALLVACGSGDGETAPANDVVEAVDVVAAVDATPDVTFDPALCDDIWTRLQDCGLFYTFPDFESDCAGWQAAGDTVRLSELERCSVFACNRLRVCVEELSEPSEG